MHVALLGVVVFVRAALALAATAAPLASYDLEVAAAASLLATAYYAALTGFAVPAQRSLVMIAVALAALVSRRRVGARASSSRRRSSSCSSWIRSHRCRRRSGCRSSRSRFCWRSRRPGRWHAGRRAVCGAARASRSSSLRLQWWIGFALLPLTAWYFGEVSVVGPLVNLVAIPFFNLVSRAAGRARDARGCRSTPFGDWARAARARRRCARRHDGARLCMRSPSFAWAALAWPLPPAPALARGVRSACAFAMCGVGVAGPPARLARAAAGRACPRSTCRRTARRASSCSTSATASPFSSRRARIVCCSTRARRRVRGSTAARRSCLPALAASGRRGLDRLIVSHADNDHCRRRRGDRRRVSGRRRAEGARRRRARGSRRASQATMGMGRRSVRDPASREDFAARGNDSSCVLQVERARARCLSRATSSDAARARCSRRPIAADVVVVPHHGSATSSSPSFVAAVGARAGDRLGRLMRTAGASRGPRSGERWQRQRGGASS